MHDFGEIVYLEMQKSGSTFVNQFLRECCSLKEINFKKHGNIGEDYDSKKFYFITIRHPFNLYSSLYRYGLDGRGNVYNRLNTLGKSGVYASFESFIEFVTDPQNATYLDHQYKEEIAEQLGLMSFRFMKLSLQFPIRQMSQNLANDESLMELESNFITDLEIKNENLNSELVRLSTELFPKLFDQESVASFFNRNLGLNSSTRSIDDLTYDREKLKAQIGTTEELLLSRYPEF